jgi:pimeloyl-ACP methyl ester carboxylesterase
METKLVEFNNQNNDILRGVITLPDSAPKRGAIFLHGFERNATVEKKFKRMADALCQKGVVVLRFDASGCGLSDGNFSATTVEKRSGELAAALDFFQKEFGAINIDFFAHSLGACVLAQALEGLEPVIGKVILMAPGLNQKDLLRYYFVRDLMKIIDPGLEISFGNYRQYFDENLFLKLIEQNDKIVNKWEYIGKQYFLEAKDLDLSRSFCPMDKKILHIHGDRDQKVPRESLGVEFSNRIIIKGGDHDLERPDFFEQWFPRAVDFLTND